MLPLAEVDIIRGIVVHKRSWRPNRQRPSINVWRVSTVAYGSEPLARYFILVRPDHCDANMALLLLLRL